MKIPTKYGHLLFSLAISMIVASIVVVVLTLVNHGTADFISNWAHNFVIAWAVAFPSVFVIAPQVHRFVKRLTTP